MEDQAQFYSEYWRKIHEEDGIATVRSRIAEASGFARDVGLAYLKELEEKQEDERHEDAVAAVIDANRILARANKISFWTIVVSLAGAATSMIAAGVSIWVAFFKS